MLQKGHILISRISQMSWWMMQIISNYLITNTINRWIPPDFI